MGESTYAGTISALVAEYDAALSEGVRAMSLEHDDPAVDRRFDRAQEALLDARPTDAAGLALQLDWWTREVYQGPDIALIEHVVAHLEANA
jgi:hypothetical protein